MLRFGVTGMLVGLGMLAGCQDLANPDETTSTEQAVYTCDVKMPPPVEWNGAKPEPAGSNGMYVYFGYTDKLKGQRWVFSRVDVDSGDITSVLTTDKYGYSKLIDLVAFGPVIGPGNPPNPPCVDQPFSILCGRWISATAMRAHLVFADATKDAQACQ